MTLRQKLYTVWAFFTVNLKRLFRDKTALFFTFLFPLIFLFVFGGLNSGGNNVGFVQSSCYQRGQIASLPSSSSPS